MDREGNANSKGAKQYKPKNLADFISSNLPALAGRVTSEKAEPPKAALSEDRRKRITITRRDLKKESEATPQFWGHIDLCRYPFASLYVNDTGKPGKIEIRERIFPGQSTQEFYWLVAPQQVVTSEDGETTGGMPGPFDRRVFHTIQRIVTSRTIKRGIPVTNPQPLEIAELLDSMGLQTNQNNNYRTVYGALDRLHGIRLSFKGIVRKAGKGKAEGELERLIRRITWKGDVGDDGLTVKTTEIYFSDYYLEGINDWNLVRPIDWDIWAALGRKGRAQRLYEVLEPQFFGLDASPYTAFRYSHLCALLPSRRQEKRTLAEQGLNLAHVELANINVKRAGGNETVRLLDKVEWVWDGDDAVIRYYPDRNYLAELRRRKRPEWDPWALDRAKEFKDFDSLAFWQIVALQVKRDYSQAALTETRSNKRVRDPRKYFVATLAKILGGVGQPIPWKGLHSAPKES